MTPLEERIAALAALRESTLAYQREKRRDTKRRWSDKPENAEKVREYNRGYNRKYSRERYHSDPAFRAARLAAPKRWQAKKQAARCCPPWLTEAEFLASLGYEGPPETAEWGRA